MNKTGMIWLMAFFSMLFLINSTSAYYDWTRYGGGMRMDATNTQFPELYVQLNSSPSPIKFNSIADNRINLGKYDYVFQENNFTNVLFLHASNYTKVLNANLVELFEFYNNATLVGQDFQYPLASNSYRYMGLFKKNSTNYQFISYNISTITETATVNTFINLNFPTAITSQGINCISSTGGYKCVSYLSNSTHTRVYEFFENGTTNILSYNIPYASTTRVPQFLDFNNDGELEYIYVDDAVALVFNQYVSLFSQTPLNSNYRMIDAKFFATGVNCGFWSCTSTPTTTYKVAVLESKLNCGFFDTPQIHITYFRPDGSIYNGINRASLDSWTYGSCNTIPSTEMSIADNNRDGNEDITLVYGMFNTYMRVRTIDYYANTMYTTDVSGGWNSPQRIIQLRINNNDNNLDFMVREHTGNIFKLVDTSTNVSQSLSSVLTLIPTDINSDGILELVGRDTSNYPIIYFSNVTNSNAEITSLTLSPSDTVGIGESLSIIINATDLNLDPLRYYVDCGNGVITSEDASPLKSCIYYSEGIYTMTPYVRDVFHLTYDEYPIPITVTATGITCNFNAVCESGESYNNCPSDCSPLTNGSSSVTGSGGGITIPSQLVNTQDETQGLLPEIYFGVLAFVSNALLPVIMIVSVVFLVLTLFAIGGIIKKLANKVGK